MVRVITNPQPLRPVDFAHANRVRPSAGFNGTAGTGFGAPYAEVPTDPARTTAKAACRLLVPDRQDYTTRQLVGVYAGANDSGNLLDTMGLSSVTFYFEGGSTTVFKPSYQTIRDANGQYRLYWGFWCWIEHNGINGQGHLYIKATPRDVTMQARVMGPYVFLPRTVPHDYSVVVAPSQPVVAGVSYQTMKTALEYFSGVSAQHPQIIITEAGAYTLSSITIPYSTGAGRCKVTATVPITFANADDASKGQFRPYYSGLHFCGSNITFDARYVSELRMDDAIGPWLDGVNFINSGGRYSPWNKGKRPVSYIVRGSAWFTECNFTDTLNSCLTGSAAQLVRGNTLDRIADDVFTNAYCVIGNSANDANSYDWKTNLPAMTVHYAGVGATATTSLAGGNDDASRLFTCKVDGASVGSITLQNTTPAGAYYDVADVVDWINATLGGSGWTATLLDDTRRATALAFDSSTFGWTDKDCKTATQTLIAKFDLHGDWYQTGSPLENVVIADNTGTYLETQNIFFTANALKDFLVVNNVFHNGLVYGYVSQFSAAQSHVVIAHNTWANQQLWQRTLGSAYDPDAYCLVANNTFSSWLAFSGDTDPITKNNHQQTGTGYGANVSVGGTEATIFANAAGGDFTPAGALLTNLKPPVVKYDVNRVLRVASDAAGALAA